ncbi:hypothetical protein BH11PAT4_BH11PAT4_6020 [soil metagenome]
MIISYTATGDVQLKTKTEPVILGSSIKIGDYTIPGPGEYDIASIQCEGQAVSGAFVYFLRDEDLIITFITKLDPTAAKVDGIADTAILVLDVRSDDTPETAKSIIKAIEPAYVFLIGAGATSSFGSQLGIPLAESSTLKVTRAGLPLEGIILVPNA